MNGHGKTCDRPSSEHYYLVFRRVCIDARNYGVSERGDEARYFEDDVINISACYCHPGLDIYSGPLVCLTIFRSIILSSP
jgi:hypothetical protein